MGVLDRWSQRRARALTLLRSLVVAPSSSRHGSLCTNASIWYLALMNSDLVGLDIKEKQTKIKAPGYRKDPPPPPETHWTLS